jgi:hypothetical protein
VVVRIGYPGEPEVERAWQPRAIEHDAVHDARQQRRELRHPASTHDHAPHRHTRVALRVFFTHRRPSDTGADRVVARQLRRCDLGTELAIVTRNEQGVRREFPRLLMHDEAKPVGKQRTHHQQQRDGRTTAAPGRKRLLGSRDDVETLAPDPVRTTEQTRVLDAVGEADQIAQRRIGRDESIAGRRLHVHVEPVRPTRRDRDDVERRHAGGPVLSDGLSLCGDDRRTQQQGNAAKHGHDCIFAETTGRSKASRRLAALECQKCQERPGGDEDVGAAAQ